MKKFKKRCTDSIFYKIDYSASSQTGQSIPEIVYDIDRTSVTAAHRMDWTFSPVDTDLQWCGLSPFPAGFLILIATACQSHQCNPIEENERKYYRFCHTTEYHPSYFLCLHRQWLFGMNRFYLHKYPLETKSLSWFFVNQTKQETKMLMHDIDIFTTQTWLLKLPNMIYIKISTTEVMIYNCLLFFFKEINHALLAKMTCGW